MSSQGLTFFEDVNADLSPPQVSDIVALSPIDAQSDYTITLKTRFAGDGDTAEVWLNNGAIKYTAVAVNDNTASVTVPAATMQTIGSSFDIRAFFDSDVWLSRDIVVASTTLELAYKATSSLSFIIETSDSQSYEIDFGDGDGPQTYSSGGTKSRTLSGGGAAGIATIESSDYSRFTLFRLIGTKWAADASKMDVMTALTELSVYSTDVYGSVEPLVALTLVYKMRFQQSDASGNIEALAPLKAAMTDLSLFNASFSGGAAGLASDRYTRFRVGSNMTSSQVDVTLAALNASGLSGCRINLNYDNAAPSTGADADINALTGRGCTVSVN